MTIINLTSHSITEVSTNTVIPASGRVVRVKASTIKVAEADGMPIYQSTFGAIDGLPDPQPNTMYVVSSLVLNALPDDRTDVVAPGNLQRDENGNPIGCYGFRIK